MQAVADELESLLCGRISWFEFNRNGVHRPFLQFKPLETCFQKQVSLLKFQSGLALLSSSTLAPTPIAERTLEKNSRIFSAFAAPVVFLYRSASMTHTRPVDSETVSRPPAQASA